MFRREISLTIEKRLREPRGFMQVVVGPRQTGKTTAIEQALKSVGLPSHVGRADDFAGDVRWIESHWQQARLLATADQPAVLVLDEIQRIPNWTDTVKRLWDEDSWNEVNLLVVLSGSSSLLLRKGMNDSLTGRFELIESTHWSLSEMSDAFGYDYETFLRLGGYPGAARLKDDVPRWRKYLLDSIVETTISKDVLQMEEIRKPALMRALFLLGSQYSAQEISYRKLLGQLDDKGNTATIAHYLDLLANAGLLSGLQKYAPKALSVRSSSPRLLVHDTALMVSTHGGDMESLCSEPASRGHLVESAVGAYLLARSVREGFEVYWWREGMREVDFVLKKGDQLRAVEVKSGRIKDTKGLVAFCDLYPEAVPLVVGDSNASVEDFLLGKVPLFR